MAKFRKTLIAALDVGSSKICCFVANVNAEGGIRVVGFAQQASAGVRNGCLVDMEAAQKAILTVVSAAEEMANERIDKIFVNLSGGKLQSKIHEIEVAIDGHEIADTDIRKAREKHFQIEKLEDSDLIHSLPVGYWVDGNRGIRDPRGMFGDLLGASFHHIKSSPGPIRNLKNCIAKCHLEINKVVVSPYASGLSCLVDDEKDLGVTLLDMGGGTTTIAVFFDGQVIFSESIPVGGLHVTNDLARGLSTSLLNAERIKILYGSAVLAQSGDNDIIDIPLVGEEEHKNINHVPRSLLTRIIRPRLEETFELVRERLDISGRGKISGRRLVLTGGASQLHGIPELSGLVLEKQVRVGRPLRISGLAEAISGPAFSTCAGLLRFGAEKSSGARDHLSYDEIEIGNRITKIGHWLKENF